LFSTVLRGPLADKERQEQLIRASSLEWVIVRPVLLANRSLHGKVKVSLNGEIGGGSIARSDVARFALAQLTSDEFLRTSPVIAEAKMP
jgi:uncharacterized protein YbjT (DUF2867 family)